MAKAPVPSPVPAPAPARAAAPPAAVPPPQPVKFADKDLGTDARTLGGYRPSGDKPPMIIRETRIVIIAARPRAGFGRRRHYEFNDIPLVTYFPER